LLSVGSLNKVCTEDVEKYIPRYEDLDDKFLILGEVALHKTLEQQDTSYLWEFAALDESISDNDSGVKYTKNNDGSWTKETKVYTKNGSIYGQGIDGKILELSNKSNRQHIDSRDYSRDDEAKFNATKQTALSHADDILNKIKTSGLDGAGAVKDVQTNLTKYREYVQNKQFPKSWLAKKIAWFRSLYEKFMLKNKYAKEPGVIGFIKHVLACITKIIDTLLGKLQNAVD